MNSFGTIQGTPLPHPHPLLVDIMKSFCTAGDSSLSPLMVPSACYAIPLLGHVDEQLLGCCWRAVLPSRVSAAPPAPCPLSASEHPGTPTYVRRQVQIDSTTFTETCLMQPFLTLQCSVLYCDNILHRKWPEMCKCV